MPGAVGEQRSRDGGDRGEGVGLAAQSKRHHRPVGHPGDIDACSIDGHLPFDRAHHGGDEPDVVGIDALWLTAARAGIPGAVEAVGVSDQEVPSIGLVVPVIGTLGLGAGAKSAVQHDHQGRRIRQSLGSVHVESSTGAAKFDALGGLSDRDGSGCSQRVAAAQAAAQHHHRHGKEEDAD